MKTYVLYHGKCSDGFASAYVVWKYFNDVHAEGASGVNDVEYHEVFYEDDDRSIPEMEDGAEIYVVDFSFREELIRQWAARMFRVTILDHHISHKKTLELKYPHNVIIDFDLDRSGVGITWDWFFPDRPMPITLQHIQDRDLWNWKLPSTKEVTLGLDSYPKDFARWDTLIDSSYRGVLKDLGTALNKVEQRQVDSLCKCAKVMDFEGYQVPVVLQAVPRIHSHVGAQLLDETEPEPPFAVIVRPIHDMKTISLRSRKGGFDVAALAEKFGGGGHQSAASFKNLEVFNRTVRTYLDL